MKKLYLTDRARQSAINEIWNDIDTLMNTPCEALGGTFVARGICHHLAKLQDVIFDEADDKNAVKRYRD